MSNLKSLRGAANLTQAALSQKSGISRRTIEKYEQNQNDLKNARAHIVISLADALGVEPKKLIE
jgi:transcriptional regulator with XRE-family HTH domain